MSIPWLITSLGDIEYSADHTTCWLYAETHNGNRLVFWGAIDQRINIVNLMAQQLPMAVMSDAHAGNEKGTIQVLKEAMLAVVPVPAQGLQQLLDEGLGDQFLAQLER
ncbi:MAG: hypothetical protein V7731_10310 [Amphritea sp.]